MGLTLVLLVGRRYTPPHALDKEGNDVLGNGENNATGTKIVTYTAHEDDSICVRVYLTALINISIHRTHTFGESDDCIVDQVVG